MGLTYLILATLIAITITEGVLVSDLLLGRHLVQELRCWDVFGMRLRGAVLKIAVQVLVWERVNLSGGC